MIETQFFTIDGIPNSAFNSPRTKPKQNHFRVVMRHVEANRGRPFAFRFPGRNQRDAPTERRTDIQQLHRPHHHHIIVGYCLAAVLFCAFGGHARAETVNQRAEREARSFLLPCTRFHGTELSACQVNHVDFIDAYLRAKAGVDDYMSEVSNYFGRGRSAPSRVGYFGIRPDRRQGCAWIIVRRESTAEDSLRRSLMAIFRAECADVSANELLAVTERADQLLRELRTAPTVAPPPRPDDHGSKGLVTTVPDAD